MCKSKGISRALRRSELWAYRDKRDNKINTGDGRDGLVGVLRWKVTRGWSTSGTALPCSGCTDHLELQAGCNYISLDEAEAVARDCLYLFVSVSISRSMLGRKQQFPLYAVLRQEIP